VALRGTPEEVLSAYRARDASSRPNETLIHDPRIATPKLVSISESIPWGGTVELKISFGVTEEMEIGEVLVHLWKSGEFACNGEIRYPDRRPLTIHPGTGELLVKLGPAYLAYGIYFVSVTVLDESCKNALLHWLYFDKIEIRGPIGSGPSHSLPLALTYVMDGNEQDSQGSTLAIALHTSDDALP
jgi:hypothetical protein